jgi:hypothetical protein
MNKCVCNVVARKVLAVMAFALLLRGAFNSTWNYVRGVSAGGGVVTLVSTALGITSFIMLRAQPADAGAGEQPSPVVMAMP